MGSHASEVPPADHQTRRVNPARTVAGMAHRSAAGVGDVVGARQLVGVVALQQAAGNRAVARLVAVQRCGPVPPEECDCHAGESAAPVVQRHEGFRVKRPLETESLAAPEVQTAASSAALALEVGRRGSAVKRLQRALVAAGADVAITSVFDARTQRAVARFQAEHGIPFPTGRQAGPKTLSTLDDHLLGGANPRPGCDAYLPGERDTSLTTRGRAERAGGLGNELRLTNFGAGQGRMKTDHEAAVVRLVKDFDLFEPGSAFEVEFVRGFTDGVDSEDRNALLREERAIDVAFFLGAKGVPNVPPAQPAADGSYDAGCDPASRANARAVLVRLKRKAVVPPNPTPNPTPRAGCDPQVTARIQTALSAAVTDLGAVVNLLRARPLSAQAKDALFVYFRREDENTGADVASELAKTMRGLGSNPPIDCDALLGCGPTTHAVTNLITGFIHICHQGALDPDDVNMERTLIHEGMHLFAGLGALGERSHGDAPGCDESDLAGQTTAFRLGNADSFAALAVRMAKSPVAGVRRDSEHFKGNDAALVTVPKGNAPVRLGGDPESFKVELRGIGDLAPSTQWRLTDGAARHYLLLNAQNEVVPPDQAFDTTVVKLGRRTRDLLAARGITFALLSVHLLNRAGLDRTVAIPLTFTP